MADTYITTEIFTPSTPAYFAYVERESLNQQLVDALMTPGKQIVVFGQTGSGKTTLLHNKLNQTYEGKISCSCTQQTTFDQILIDAFDQLETFYISETNTKKSTKLTAKFIQDFKIIKGEISGEFGNSKETKVSRILPPQLTPSRLARFIGEIKYCWVIEDIHKISKEEKIKVSQVMKVFMDQAVYYPELKIILVGAVGTAKEIITLEKDMRNRTIEIYVPLMSQNELKEIISKGEQRLNISLEYGLTEAISKFSCGLPSVTHQLCLNICLNKNIRQTCDFFTELSISDFISALKKYVLEISDSLKNQFEKVITNHKNSKFLLDLLRTILQLNKYGVKEIEIRKKMGNLNIDFKEDSFKKNLLYLSSQSAEEILNYDSVSKEYSFLNPFFKVYCFCHIEIENYEKNEQLSFDFQRQRDKEVEMVRLILENGGYSDIDF